MLINDYFIIDDVLKNPEDLVKLSKGIKFYTRTTERLDGLTNVELRITKPEGKWLGYRSHDIYDYDPKLFNLIFDQIFDKILSGISCKYEYTISSYLHFSPEDCVFDESQIHTDIDTSFAGVIYLNQNPTKNSGTILYLDNQEIKIENKYNRLVMYKSNIEHKTAGGFGKNTDDSRLTFVFFITRFFVDIQNYRKENYQNG